MAAQPHIPTKCQSVAGLILLGFGTWVLYRGMGSGITWLRESLFANGSDALGTLPALTLMAGRIFPALDANHLKLMLDILRHGLGTLRVAPLAISAMVLVRTPCGRGVQKKLP